MKLSNVHFKILDWILCS